MSARTSILRVRSQGSKLQAFRAVAISSAEAFNGSRVFYRELGLVQHLQRLYLREIRKVAVDNAVKERSKRLHK